MRSLIFLRILVVLIVVFSRPYDSINHDGVNSMSLIWSFTKLGLLYYMLSVLVVSRIFLRLPIIVVFAILPIVYLNSFELYNRFYIVIAIGLVFQNGPKLFNILSKIFLVMLQPLNVVLLVNKFKILLSIILVIGVVNIWFLDDLKILLISYAYLNPKLASMYALLDGVQFVHEKGNLSLLNMGYPKLIALLLPILYFPLRMSSLFFQFMIIVIASRGLKLLLLVILGFLIYTMLTPNLASFYRNFVPIWVLIEMNEIKNENIIYNN
jgi:hypothetical protein